MFKLLVNIWKQVSRGKSWDQGFVSNGVIFNKHMAPCCSVTKSCLILWPYGLQHARVFISFTMSWNLLRFIESVILSSYLILCCPFLLMPSIFPSIPDFSSESALHIRWPKYWSFSISPSNEYSEFIFFKIDWFDLAVQGTLGSILQHPNLKVSILWYATFFMFQLSYLHMTTGKNYSFHYMDLCRQSDVSAF